jgi:DNA-binding XRE family transcriptional regulator
MNAISFSQILDDKYGQLGSDSRAAYEEQAQAFRIGVLLKEVRKEMNMTQAQLALKIGTKKSYISRVERGFCDIQVATLQRIIEKGLGKKLEISIY